MNGYLLVQSWHMPRAYFPIEEMRQAGVYDQIKAIVDARSAEMKARRAEAMTAANTRTAAQLRVPRFTSKITLRLHVGQMSHSRFRA